MKFLDLRAGGYELLAGAGLEIGAFEHPARLPESCAVEYVDRFTMAQAQVLFPEVDCGQLQEPDYLVDLDTEGLQAFPSASQDFVILNHVIEHVVNPVFILEELFRVVLPGGHCVIAAPDKEHTFDRERPLTALEALVEAYESGRSEASAEDYRDILTYIHKEHLGQPEHVLQEYLESYRARREHLHVWTSASFRAFLVSAMSYLNVQGSPVYEVTADDNQFEYFGVWQKT